MALGLPTGARGQALALAVTILAVASVWIGMITPAWDWYDDRSELLRRQSAMARRMASLVDGLPELRREAASASGSATSNAAIPRLTGATDSLAAAALQQRIEEFAANAGVHIGSEEIPPGRTDGDLRAVSVRVTMTAPYRSLVVLLLALARSDTPMVVDDLLLRGPPGTTGNEDLPVETSLTVTAYRAARVGTQ